MAKHDDDWWQRRFIRLANKEGCEVAHLREMSDEYLRTCPGFGHAGLTALRRLLGQPEGRSRTFPALSVSSAPPLADGQLIYSISTGWFVVYGIPVLSIEWAL